MTHDDEQTARDLIGSAFSDAMAGAPTVDNPIQLVELIAAQMRDHAELIEPLRNGLSALLAIEVHQLGELNATKHAGIVGVHLVSFTPDPTAEHLLKRLAGDGSSAYALVHHAQPDDEPAALVMLTAAPTGALLGTVAQIDGARSIESHPVELEQITEHPETARTMRALVAAATRKPADQ